MNKNAKKWVEALRSGKYEQGYSQLRTKNNGYCCLGVLCDVYRKEEGGRWRKDSAGGWKFLNADSILPEEVTVWAGLTSEDGAIPEERTTFLNTMTN